VYNEQALKIFTLLHMTLIHISTKQDFQQKVLQSTKPVLVDFFAEWCGPCKIMGPVLEEVATEIPGVDVVKVDVDSSSEIASEYNISSIPTFLVFSNGEVVSQAVGAVGKAQIKKMVVNIAK